MKKYNPFVWECNFPPVYGQTSFPFLKNCADFHAAKHGDMCAALSVANKCINPHTIGEIKQKYPDAILLPVITNNKLPMALAEIIGMKMYTRVSKCDTVSRKSLSAMKRLLDRPIFEGKIIKGKNHIIIDDIITQGGTISALRKHIIKNGGIVAAVVTLSYSVDSRILVPNQEDIVRVNNKFRLPEITSVLKYYNISDDLQELTRAQIRYLLRFNELEGLINKIEKTKIE